MILLMAGFTGGMFSITGLSIGATSILVAYLWGKGKIRSWTGSDGATKITVPNGHRGRSDMHILNKGLKYVKEQTGEQGTVGRVLETKTKIFKKTRSQRDREKRNRQ